MQGLRGGLHRGDRDPFLLGEARPGEAGGRPLDDREGLHRRRRGGHSQGVDEDRVRLEDEGLHRGGGEAENRDAVGEGVCFR